MVRVVTQAIAYSVYILEDVDKCNILQTEFRGCVNLHKQINLAINHNYACVFDRCHVGILKNLRGNLVETI